VRTAGEKVLYELLSLGLLIAAFSGIDCSFEELPTFEGVMVRWEMEGLLLLGVVPEVEVVVVVVVVTILRVSKNKGEAEGLLKLVKKGLSSTRVFS